MTVKVRHINVWRRKVAWDVAYATYATANQKGVDVLLVIEPNRNKVRGDKWLEKKRIDLAVLFLNRKVTVRDLSVVTAMCVSSWGLQYLGVLYIHERAY